MAGSTAVQQLVLLLCFATFVTPECNVPPSLWCTSRPIARSCNVEKQCEAYLAEQQAAKVNITLYYESLCGGCRGFIKTQYYPTYQKLSSIMNVNLVPYGNAHEAATTDRKWTFTCQHGEEECIGNLIETCTLHYYPDAKDFFPFIYCIETSSLTPRQAAQGCATQCGIDLSSIETCVNSDLGNQLEHEMAVRTNALSPPHQYVPWITVNGQHTSRIQNEATFNLAQLICDTYTGNPKPEACNEIRSNGEGDFGALISMMELKRSHRKSNI